MKLLYLTVFILTGYQAFSQSPSQLFFSSTVDPVFIKRDPDLESVSSPDSSGNTIALQMPSARNNTAAAQLLPYPVIFIHGLNSSSETWKIFSGYLDTQYGLTYGGRFDYCLNFDRNHTTANLLSGPLAGGKEDIGLFEPTLIPADYYFINFDVGYNGSFHPLGNTYDVLSNQSAIEKQGIAVKWAIQEVLKKTGRDKVVLMGHSMGGLAARAYLQNPSIWQSDGSHHVAKLVTTGTPHGGSNATAYGLGIGGINEQSEAVRDLRSSYYYSKDKGVFLWGGMEIQNATHMDDGYSNGAGFYNIDVNANGITNEQIIGLNEKKLMSDLDYSCIIGQCSGCFISSEAGDGIVSAVNADLKNIYTSPSISRFYYTAYAASEIHTSLPGLSLQNMQGLDEPGIFDLAYHVDLDTYYTGFTSVQADGKSVVDEDHYKFHIEKQGILTVKVQKTDLTDLTVDVYDEMRTKIGATFHSNGSAAVSFELPVMPGNYYLVIANQPTDISYLHPYKFILNNTISTGVEEIKNEAFSIYPNPVTTTITIYNRYNVSPNATIEIVDALGQEVRKEVYSSLVNVSSLSKGIYFLKIKMEEQIVITKFIKE